MRRVGFVGAGAATAAATVALDGADVTVLEKSGGVCGRAATRRRGDRTYEYGANYLTPDDERVRRLVTERIDTDGLVEVRGPTYTFDAEGTVEVGRDPDGPRWTYRDGLTQVAKRLFARADATVHRRTRVTGIERDGDGWTLVDADGESWGPFDAVGLNPPAPQTATLLRSVEWSSPVRESLVDAAAAVDYRTVWTAVLGYPFDLDVPYYALVNPGKDHEVGWVAREECKPGHVPDGESLVVVQANHDWSVARADADPADVVAALAGHAAALLDDDRLTDPAWTDHQFWRYALPEDGVDPDPVRTAESAGLYCLGDWVAGEGRVGAALANGLSVGDRM